MLATTIRKVADVGGAVVRTSIATTRQVADVIGSGLSKMTKSYRDAGATVVGQTRSAVERSVDQASVGTKEVVGQARFVTNRAVDQASSDAKQVIGQARSAAERTAAQMSKGAKEVVGQARAQGKAAGEQVDEIAEQTVAELDEIAERTAEQANEATQAAADAANEELNGRPAPGTPYEQWTKSELYDRATELELEGRSQMNKKELIEALRGA